MSSKDETRIIIEERIDKIREASKELLKYQERSKEKFLNNTQLQYASMFAMILAIEAICDIGSHILAKYYLVKCEHYEDIIKNLGEYDVIPKELSGKSKEMADFRNFLIHLYMKIDPKKVYNNLQKAPEEFTKFAKYFVKFLEKTKNN